MEIFKKNKKILLLLIFLGIFGIISTGFALELDWPASPGGTNLNNNSTLPQLIQYLYEWGIALGGLAVFIALVSAGFEYLGSAGDVGKMTNARKKIGSAIVGLVLLLSSWLILNTINPELTTFQPVSFSISNLPPVIGGEFTDAPPCEYVKFYEEINWKGNILDIGGVESLILQAGYESHDFGIGVKPKSAKAFYTKPSSERHCNYGMDIGDDCIGIITCEKGVTECESGPTGGGCTLELAEGNVFAGIWGCGERLGYVIATESDFTNTVKKDVQCVSLILP